jgi:hypothetical protein
MEPGAFPAAQAGRPRWVGVGRSTHPDPATAGGAAAREALAGRDDTRLVLALASGEYDPPELLAAVDAVTGGAPLVGSTTSGQITTAAGEGPRSVVIIALGGDGLAASTAAVELSGRSLRDIGAEAAACVGDVADREHRVLVLLSSVRGLDHQELVLGAYSVVGAGVPLVGGRTATDRAEVRALQFPGRAVLGSAVVAAAIGSDAPLGVGARHGWRPVGEPMLVTGSDGPVIAELEGRPALDLYLERLGADPAVGEDPAAFAAFALTHPLGLARRSGESHVRHIAGADAAARTLRCPTGVPPGSLVWTMEGDDASVLHATDAACTDAIAALGGRPPLGLMLFDCAARRGVLGDGAEEREAARVARHAGGAPLAGLFTFGEIARTRGIHGFHNQTLVVLAVA